MTPVAPRRVNAERVVRSDHLKPGGGLHGGLVTAFADSLCGCGTVTALPESNAGFTTILLSSQLLGRTRDGERLGATATLTQGGRQIQAWDVVLSPAKRTVGFVRVTRRLRYPG